MRTRPGDGGDGQMQRRLTTGRGDRTHPRFERSDPLLEHRHGGIADPRINVTGLLHIEEGGCVIGVAKHERRRQINGRGACAGVTVWGCAGVQGQRIESVIVALAHIESA